MTNFHSIMHLEKASWLQPYIRKNTNLPAAAKGEMAKDFFNLQNRSLSETLRTPKSTPTLDWGPSSRCETISYKPQFNGLLILSKFLVGFNHRNVKSTSKKPIFLAFTVLELSIVHMFQYEQLIPISLRLLPLFKSTTLSLCCLLPDLSGYSVSL